MKHIKDYEPICKCEFGKLAEKVDLKPDFFSGFDPKKRKEIVKAEADFYHRITEPFSVDTHIITEFIGIPARDGFAIPVKVYRPVNTKGVRPAFIFIHGGGFITCSVETHNFVPAYIAAHSGCICFSIDYRLAPEFKFPKGLEDCYDTAKWLIQNAEKIGIDAAKVAVGGDSSGGNFAAVLSQMAKQDKEVAFCKEVLIYPVTDLSNDIPKRSAEVYVPVGSSDGETPSPSFLQMYLPDGTDVHNPMISPLFGDDLSGLPKTLFILAECDAFCDDGLYYAKALQDSGVDVSFYIYKGMPHAFILRTYEETFAALDEICKFLIE